MLTLMSEPIPRSARDDKTDLLPARIDRMRLEFSGAPEIAAARQKVWERLMDPNFVAASAPGVESVEAVDPPTSTAAGGLGMGAVKVRSKLEVELPDMGERERLKGAARGKAPGSAVDVVSSVRLEEAGNGRTR